MNKESFESVSQSSKRAETPEEELDFLRREVEKKEAELEKGASEEEKESAAAEKVKEYQKTPASEVVEEKAQMPEEDKEAYALDLAPERHDEKVSEFLGVMEEKGIHNTLSIVDDMQDEHLEDDLHRVLIQWMKEGYPIKGIKKKSDLWRSLNMMLFEVSLPESEEEDKNKSFKELVSSMEQFYAGMHSLSESEKESHGHFALELAVRENGQDIILYVTVPTGKIDVFKKQLLSVFPNAQIKEQKNDYNIFAENGASAGGVAELEKSVIYPLKNYENFDYDPLNIIINSFSKISAEGEGAALQFVFDPNGKEYSSGYSQVLSSLQKGNSVKDAVRPVFGGVPGMAKDLFKELVGSKKDTDQEKSSGPDQMEIEALKEKMDAPVLKTNIRVLTSAAEKGRAEALLDEIESSFYQFEHSQGNRIRFRNLKDKKLSKLIDGYIFRSFRRENEIPLNTKEATSLIHMPAAGETPSPQFKRHGFKTASPPSDMDSRGIFLGINDHRNEETEVYLSEKDRLRHFYTVGQTGTGKTALLKNMITQDIENGEGVCMIDPHGSDIEDVLGTIPKERFDDVIYFEPGYTNKVMGLNMLEYDPNKPEQKTFVVNEVFSIFQKLYADTPEGMGPVFQQYFRNAAMLVLEHPESGSTLLDISRVLSDEEFRSYKLSKSNNPVVNQFWEKIASQAEGESQLQNIVPYITSKFDVFAANDIMRPIIAQQKSAFDFRKIMDKRKILLVNLAKGKLGDINSHLLGLILVGRILMAALSRGDASRELPPFYLYIDEFQNITTDSINTILAEARKYKLSLNIAHQFIAQLDENIRNSVFGNVGSIASFRVGSEDAEFLSQQFQPEFSAKDLTNLENFNVVAKTLVNGHPSKPFNLRTVPPAEKNEEQIDDLKELSYIKYGRSKGEVEEEVSKKYQDIL